MKKIKLTGRRGKGLYALVDDEDFERCNKKSWYVNKKGRPKAIHKIEDKWKQISMHRLILDFPKNYLVDHIDGNPLNNCKSNLRLCSHMENQRHRKPRARSGFKGVRPSGYRWEARIVVNKKVFSLGSFEKKEEAAKVYNDAAKKYFGEYAWLNPV